jgi:Flp pilus assembly protein TadB
MDVKYFVIVGLLLVIIMAVLAQLWQLERERRITAEKRLSEMYLEESLRAAVEGAAKRWKEDAVANRKELPRETVKWNGTLRDVLLIGAEEGRGMGFEAGDVVHVREDEPATQPAGAEK